MFNVTLTLITVARPAGVTQTIETVRGFSSEKDAETFGTNWSSSVGRATNRSNSSFYRSWVVFNTPGG